MLLVVMLVPGVFGQLVKWNFYTKGCSTQDIQTKAPANLVKSKKKRRNELITKEFQKSSMILSLRK